MKASGSGACLQTFGPLRTSKRSGMHRSRSHIFFRALSDLPNSCVSGKPNHSCRLGVKFFNGGDARQCYCYSLLLFILMVVLVHVAGCFDVVIVVTVVIVVFPAFLKTHVLQCFESLFLYVIHLVFPLDLSSSFVFLFVLFFSSFFFCFVFVFGFLGGSVLLLVFWCVVFFVLVVFFLTPGPGPQNSPPLLQIGFQRAEILRREELKNANFRIPTNLEGKQ